MRESQILGMQPRIHVNQPSATSPIFDTIQPSATHLIFETNLLRTWTVLSSFDEISLLLETIHRCFRPRYVVLAIAKNNEQTAWATLSSF